MSSAVGRKTKVISLVALATAILLLACSPLHASTIVFETDSPGSGAAVTYSPTNAAVTVTNWAMNRLLVSDGILPDPVEYDVDGNVGSNDPGGAGALEFFIDGCVPHHVGSFLNRYDCTPTVASYIQIVGSVPDLGIPLQSLLIGSFIGGAPDSFLPPGQATRNIFGGGTDTISSALSLALGFEPATLWNFSVVLHLGFQFDPLAEDTVTSTHGELSAVPEPGTMLLLGTGLLGAVRRLRAGR